MAVRSALGASRSRIDRAICHRKVLFLVGASTVLGLLASEWTMRLLLALIPEMLRGNVPYLVNLGLNSHIFRRRQVRWPSSLRSCFTLTPRDPFVHGRKFAMTWAEGSRGVGRGALGGAWDSSWSWRN